MGKWSAAPRLAASSRNAPVRHSRMCFEVQIAEHEAGDRRNQRDGFGDARLVGEAGMERNAEQGHAQMFGLADHELHPQLLVGDRPAGRVERRQEDYGARSLAQQGPVAEEAVLAAAPEEHVHGLGLRMEPRQPLRRRHLGERESPGSALSASQGQCRAAAPAATAPLAQTELGEDGQPGRGVEIEGLAVAGGFVVKAAPVGCSGAHGGHRRNGARGTICCVIPASAPESTA